MTAREETAGFAERLAIVLDTFGDPPHERSFMQIVRKTALPRASVHRIIGQLLDMGYLAPCPTGRSYRLGLRLCSLLQANQTSASLKALAAPVLADLAQDFGLTSFAARLAGGSVDLFASATPLNPERSHLRPGHGNRPLHACSSSKAILAFLPDALRADLLAEAPREEFTPRTQTDTAKMAEEYSRIRACGYAVCDGEIHDGVVSLAVPVQVPRLGARYALGLIGLAARFTPPDRVLASDHLKRASLRFAALIDPALPAS
jgi:IclR family transcriptional regulator, acetate operon repressor